jgi:hypothetical protein
MPFTRKLPCTATRRIPHGLCSEFEMLHDAEDAGHFVAIQMSTIAPWSSRSVKLAHNCGRFRRSDQPNGLGSEVGIDVSPGINTGRQKL